VIKPVLALSVLALVLAGCSAAPADNAGDGVISIVASTNVYGDIASTIGGADVTVTSIIDDPEQDPHEFEANARVQLALSRADIVIVNGGGYDDFATTMLSAAGNDSARVIDAVQLSGHDASADGFNEHVWYDYPTMVTVVKAIAAALGIADPANASTYDARANGIVAQLDTLTQLESGIKASVPGAGVLITEPVPLYALDASGLRNLTPPAFSEAIEDGTDASPELLQQVLGEVAQARIVVYNEQTGGPQTDALLAAARQAGVPTLGVTETLPDGMHYFDWQEGFLTELLKDLVS
jgi:zinc/manganese transport system substrate-binding protein